jgi:large subunit ribosomal protein L4
MRRDIIHNAFIYYRYLDYQTTDVTKTKGQVAGSGKKPAPQKGRGAARIGNKRANFRNKGGVAHGKVPRDYSFTFNKKIRLQALKALLSAKLFEDRFIFVNDERIPYHKTKYLDEVIAPFGDDKLMMLTGFDQDKNFMLAQQKIDNLNVFNPQVSCLLYLRNST